MRALRVDVDGVRLADVAREPDLLRLRQVGDVHELEAAARLRLEAELGRVVAAAALVGRVDQQLRLGRGRGFAAFSSALPFGVASTSCWRPSAALGLLDAGRRRWPATNFGDAATAVVGQLDDRLAAAVRARRERADGRVRLAALREEVDVGVGLPVGIDATGSHCAPGPPS